MIAAEAVAAILLAAGGSTRFGARDKLAAPLDGLPLGLHAARTLGTIQFAARIAVVRQDGPDFGACGFATVVNADRDAGQSGSIRLGLARARLAEPRAVLIALADMPFVTTAHVKALLAAFDGEHAVVGSSDGERACPPALFGSSAFGALAGLSGDAGARAILRGARLVAAPSSELADIDTPRDLATASAGRYARGLHRSTGEPG